MSGWLKTRRAVTQAVRDRGGMAWHRKLRLLWAMWRVRGEVVKIQGLMVEALTKQEELMANLQSIQEKVSGVSSELDRIATQVGGGGLTQAETDQVDADLQALLTKAQGIGTPTQP